MNILRLRWRGSKQLLIAVCIVALSAVGGIVFAQTGNGITIKWSSIDAGAVIMNDGSPTGYVLRGTIGQPEGREGVLGGGAYSLQGGITILPTPVTIPPSGAIAAPNRNYFIDPNLTLRWERVSYALGYWVQVARDSKFTQLVIDDPNLSVTQLSRLVSLPGDGTYYWHVRAKSKTSPLTWGNWSTTETFVVSIP